MLLLEVITQVDADCDLYVLVAQELCNELLCDQVRGR